MSKSFIKYNCTPFINVDIPKCAWCNATLNISKLSDKRVTIGECRKCGTEVRIEAFVKYNCYAVAGNPRR